MPHTNGSLPPLVHSEVNLRCRSGWRVDQLSIDSFTSELLLEQVKPRAILMRRTSDSFLRQSYEGFEATISLDAIECELRLSDIYDRVDFTPESLREELADYAM